MIDQTLAVESGIPEPNAISLAEIIQVKIQWINCGGIQLPILSWWDLNKGARYEYIALSEKGDEFIDSFTCQKYKDYIGEWQKHLGAYFER